MNDRNFRSANIESDKISAVLKSGVYAVYAVIDGVRYEGMANAGARPTFGDGAYKVETHLFDFAGDLYGRQLTVCFKDFIRGIKKFKTRGELAAQQAEDKKNASGK